MLLSRCGTVFGEIGTPPRRLRLTTYERVLMQGWSLYDERRLGIPDAAFIRTANGMKLLAGQVAVDVVPARVADSLPRGPTYFWLGPIHLHFGHFLLSSLSRLWAVLDDDPARFTFVYCGGGEVADLAAIPYVHEMLNALGATPDRLLRVEGPILIPEIVVPEPSTVENLWVNSRFIDTLHRVRDVVAPGVGHNTKRNPVYVSKKQVKHGIRTVGNEDALTDILARRGIEAAFPDALGFRDQVRFWCEHRSLIGYAASAFHMAGVSTGKRLCTLFGYPPASINQFNIDRAAGNAHLHLNAGAAMVSHGANSQFSDVMAIEHPGALADELCRIAGNMDNWVGQEAGPEPRSPWTFPAFNEPFGRNLARDGIASQSSDYTLAEAGAVAARNALSGRLTGGAQSHTAQQDRPWWQVDLRVRAYIYEVRVFNRCDGPVAAARLGHFLVFLSDDGTDWRMAYEHHGAPPGGVTGGPWRWQPSATVARFVRIALPGTDYLHFDQVEVFGEPVVPGPLTEGPFPIG